MTAKPVAKIEPFAPIICINTELQINFIKKPAAKLIKANRCSLTPCKMAAVTVYNANNNATGEYQASKFPVKSKLAIPNNAPYASGTSAESPTIEGMTSKSTICSAWLISLFSFFQSLFVKEDVSAGTIVKDNPVAIVIGILINLCPFILIVASANSAISLYPAIPIDLINVQESTTSYKGIAIPTSTNGPAYDNNCVDSDFILMFNFFSCA